MSELPVLVHEWRERLGLTGCTCPVEYKSLGRLYGISMGKGWVRLRDDPDCPHHGRKAVEDGRAAESLVPPS